MLSCEGAEGEGEAAGRLLARQAALTHICQAAMPTTKPATPPYVASFACAVASAGQRPR